MSLGVSLLRALTSSFSPPPMPVPERTEVEVFSQASNAWVIRTPGRQFPAAVVQGDSLSHLFALAQSVLERARACAGGDAELVDEAEELRDLLWGRVAHLEETLRTHDIKLPYERQVWPR